MNHRQPLRNERSTSSSNSKIVVSYRQDKTRLQPLISRLSFMNNPAISSGRDATRLNHECSTDHQHDTVSMSLVKDVQRSLSTCRLPAPHMVEELDATLQDAHVENLFQSLFLYVCIKDEALAGHVANMKSEHFLPSFSCFKIGQYSFANFLDPKSMIQGATPTKNPGKLIHRVIRIEK
jgi:hypothetical protein